MALGPFEDKEYPGDVSSFAKEIKTARTNGVLAGFCLMYFHALEKGHYETAARNPAEPSQRVVFHLCSEHDLGREKRANGDKRDYDTVTVKFARQIWKRYQRVSHLWASYIHLLTRQLNRRVKLHIGQANV